MKLYYFPGACALASHIVLEWTGAPYEAVKLDRAALKSPEFLKLNPNGAVPLLVDGDFVLSQNAAILFYLAERSPQARLLGDTPRARAEVMRWFGLLNSDVHPAFKPIFAPQRYLPDESQSAAIAEAARGHVRTYLDQLNARLQGRDWLVDERSIADPYLLVMVRWALKLKIGLEAFGNLVRFRERMLADAGVRAAITAEEGQVG
ncbi:MAG TPA: glutathione binding-like protein [Steroidobacteraceae bacterium]|nr:glutathione binding-like protein [Steroidobacteraceae bacterium]